MGIRGLTTFIANHSHKYLDNFELHDTYVVIDGNNIASHLYKWHCKSNDCFGGDYDKYADVVYKFFSVLSECNITPLIVFDGGYEDKKVKTIYSRLKERLKAAKSLNSVTEGSVHMLPLFLRELFKDIVRKLNVKAVRCDFEGDYETACIARALRCPVLSYDSDFYIFDVQYIPFSTMSLQVCHKKGNVKVIACQIYKIENFLKSFGGINRENLPLLATLLGNDYVKKGVFSKFYSQIKLPKRKPNQSDKQRQIAAVIKWLKEETYESAVRKILGRLKTKQRKRVAGLIHEITQGYVVVDSLYMKYFEIEQPVKAEVNVGDIKALLDGISLEQGKQEDGESSSDDSAESLSELDVGVVGVASCIENLVPGWFLENFRLCKYPSCFMDMIFKNTYYFIPQIEDYSNVCSHNVSAIIISAIHKILTSASSKFLLFVSRNDDGRIKRYDLPSTSIPVPKLQDLQTKNREIDTQCMLQILSVDTCFIDDVLPLFPQSWCLYIIAIKYWAENASLKVAKCHVYALVLSAVVIDCCDKKVGYYRSTTKFQAKFGQRVQTLLNAPREGFLSSCDGIIPSLDAITTDDALLCLNTLMHCFQIDYKMRSNVKLFDISIVDAYAQFQSCILHIKYLNSLLNEPFQDIVISEFFDGTFIYNMCANLAKRNDLDVYMETLLKNSPSVLHCFKLITDKLNGALNVVHSVSVGGKRRRKRRKRKVEVDSVEDDLSLARNSEASDDDIVDENNRYSILLKNKNVF